MNKNTTIADLAWLAGIIDGEGSIFIMKQKRKDRERTFNYILRISVQSADKIMANECGIITAEGAVMTSIEKRDNQSNTFKWQVSGRKAAKVLNELLPYLRVKKDQASAAIEFQNTTKKHWQHMTTEDYVRQETFYYKLKQLKVDLKVGKDTIEYKTINSIVKTESDTRTNTISIPKRDSNGKFISVN